MIEIIYFKQGNKVHITHIKALPMRKLPDEYIQPGTTHIYQTTTGGLSFLDHTRPVPVLQPGHTYTKKEFTHIIRFITAAGKRLKEINDRRHQAQQRSKVKTIRI